jgi:hypothetical protein
LIIGPARPRRIPAPATNVFFLRRRAGKTLRPGFAPWRQPFLMGYDGGSHRGQRVLKYFRADRD